MFGRTAKSFGSQTSYRPSAPSLTGKIVELGWAEVWADLQFSPDGANMLVGNYVGTEIITRFALSVPWDIVTAVDANDSLDVSAQVTTLGGFHMNPEGTVMLVQDSSLGRDYNLHWTFATPWVDTSAGVYAGGKNPTLVERIYTSVWGDAGTKIFRVSKDFNKIYRYAVSVAYDATTMADAFDQEITITPTPRYLKFSGNGRHMYVITPAGAIYHWRLAAAWDLSDIVQMSDISPLAFAGEGFDVMPRGGKAFGLNADDVRELRLG